MALQAIVQRQGVHRVVLEQYPEGVYLLVFDAAESKWPCRDNLQNDWAMAKRAASQDYAVAENMWQEVPDTGVMR